MPSAVVHNQIDSCSGRENPTHHGCIKEDCLINLPTSETFMRFLAVRRCADGRVQPVSTLSLLTRGGQAARDTCGQGATQPHCSHPPVSPSTHIHVTVRSELQKARSPIVIGAVCGAQSEQVALSCTTVWPRRLTLTVKQATLLAGVHQHEDFD